MLKLLIKLRWLVVFFTVLFMIGGVLYDVISQYYKVSMTLSINYPGIEQGLTPVGTRFNVFEITSNEILELALSKANLPGITVDDLRDRITIYPIMPQGISQRIREANAQGQDYSYIPNEYSISYSQKNKLSRNHTKDMLSAIADGYKETFVKKYTYDSIPLTQTDLSNISYEYVELPDLYDNKIDSMIEFLNTKNNENSAFRSAETGQTFSGLINMLENLKDVDVANLRAFVTISKLSKDRQELLDKLNYDVKMLNREYQKAYQESVFVKNTINQYDASVTEFVFIPSLDENNDFYMNRTKTGLDYLTLRSHNSGIKAENIKYQMDVKKNLISIFQEPGPTGDTRDSLLTEAGTFIGNINTKLKDISEKAEITVRDYTAYSTKDYLRFTIPEISLKRFINMSNMKSAIYFALLGFFVSCFLIILIYKTYLFLNSDRKRMIRF